MPLVTRMAREKRLKFFEEDQALERLRAPLVTILAREMRLKIFSRRPSFGDVASAANHDIGARNEIEILKSTKPHASVRKRWKTTAGVCDLVRLSVRQVNSDFDIFILILFYLNNKGREDARKLTSTRHGLVNTKTTTGSSQA